MAKFPREHLMLRTISVLHALSADRASGHRMVNATFAGALGADYQASLSEALAKENASFLEPLQQLVLLRRAMTVCDERGQVDVATDAGLHLYFDACRFTADLVATTYVEATSDTKVEIGLKTAAGFLPRIWLTNPVNPNYWTARARLMLDRIPAGNPALAARSAALKGRFPTTIGLSYEEVATIVQFLSYWTIAPDLQSIFRKHGSIRLNPDTWLIETDVPPEAFRALLKRTAWDWTERLSDSSYGGPLSVLPFRDRPFVTFRDGTVAPAAREFVLEKLTADLFWWLKDPDVPQSQLWQADWGVLAEGYVSWLLEQAAVASNCGFARNVKWGDEELDAAIWFKGHVALVEVSSSGLSDEAGNSGDWTKLKTGLQQTFVQSTRPGKPPKAEAIMQLARDVRALLDGTLAEHIPIRPDALTRVYPVLVATDRRLRVPGAWYYLNAKLQEATGPTLASALVPLNVEDVEEVEQLLNYRGAEFRGTPPGILRVLRRWDVDRGSGPSWWQFMEWLAGPVLLSRHIKEEMGRWKDEVRSHFKTDPWTEHH
ncbi:MAG TPA: hypothetical protein DCM67_08915 [Propionibacteriaceae bacterium]|nr:hypothetical protein [Propionibacteriaceae bacterium]